MITLIMVQAEATISLTSLLNKAAFSIDNLNTKTLLSRKGGALATKFKIHGSKMIESDNNKSIEQVVQLYLKNTSKYDGVPLDIYDATEFFDKYGLNISTNDLGLSLISLPINKNKNDLLDKINVAISTVHDNSEIFNVCKSRFHDESNPSYCIL